jgi:trimethylamine---corrinoid protein Co-methyltransferase
MILSDSSSTPAPHFRVLNESQCKELYEATLECLQRVGVQMHNAQARDLLASSGAEMNGQIVHIPAHLVEDAIKNTPPTFSVWGRDGGHEMRVAIDRVHFGPGPTCTYFIDPSTGERRPARRGDAGLVAKVCDALPNIDYIMGLSLFSDVTPSLASVYEFAEEMANTTKPVVAWANTTEALQDIHRIAVAVAGDEKSLRAKPNYAYFTTYESPLKLADAPLANLMWTAEHGIPSICLGGPTVGLESPFSGASALVLYLSSALAALTVVQLTHPGAAMVIGGLPSMMDMHTGRPAYGSPEASLHSAASADLARYLHLPFMGTAGASESKTIDAQAGTEAAFQVMLAALSGASLVHDVGFLDCADIGSLDYLVLTDEVISMAARIMRGVDVNADTIMMDLIEKVGPGGTFMNQAKSVARCRSEAWVPSILDRSPFSAWDKNGRQETNDAVRKKLQKILSSHHPTPLQSDVVEKIQKILDRAEERERK